MTLADQIIEQGPFAAGQMQPEWMRRLTATRMNELREELIAGRQAVEDLREYLEREDPS